MKCRKQEFIRPEAVSNERINPDRGELPENLVDCLTGEEIPFSNRDNIRQKTLKFLIDEKGYLKSDITPDREIRFELEGMQLCSLVDITVRLNNLTVMIWKCASGSLVTRERQIIASARLLEDYVVPVAAVTNGKDLELLDTLSEKVIGTGFQAVPSRQELIDYSNELKLKPANKKKLIYEQRILYTYDAISCPVNQRT